MVAARMLREWIRGISYQGEVRMVPYLPTATKVPFP